MDVVIQGKRRLTAIERIGVPTRLTLVGFDERGPSAGASAAFVTVIAQSDGRDQENEPKATIEKYCQTIMTTRL